MTNVINPAETHRRVVALEARLDSLDIVEKLPDGEGPYIVGGVNKCSRCFAIVAKGHPHVCNSSFNGDPNKILPSQSISQMAMKPKHEWPIPEPTAEASDGKRYPVGWFTVQQRFEDVTPPKSNGLWILVYLDGADPNEHLVNDIDYDIAIDNGNTWTLSPLPPKPKEEANVWDEYLNDSGSFLVPVGAGISRFPVSPEFVGRNSRIFSALAAYINHILSQEKG